MFKPIVFPRGIFNLFSIGMSSEEKVTDEFEYRPDKTCLGMKDELINNNLSNISPISCVKGKTYKKAGTVFKAYFGFGS